MIKIVSLSGTDGSGKTTQINRIAQQLSSRGYKTHYFHVVQFSALNQLHSQFKSPADTKSQSPTAKAVIQSSKFHVFLRQLFLYIDIFRFHFLVQNLDKKGYDFILTDRYFYDVVVNIAFLENCHTLMKAPIAKPDYGFFLNVPPTDIMKRSSAPEQGLVYLEKKYRLYHAATSKYGLTKINGSASQAEVTREILRHIIGQ